MSIGPNGILAHRLGGVSKGDQYFLIGDGSQGLVDPGLQFPFGQILSLTAGAGLLDLDRKFGDQLNKTWRLVCRGPLQNSG